MKIWIFFATAYWLGVACAAVVAADQQNITKRGVNDQINYYPDPSQIRYIAALANPNPHHSPQPVHPPHPFYQNEEPTVQLYEYQPPDHIQAPTTQYHNHQHTNVVNPIQHGAVLNHGHHGQSYSKYVYPYAAQAAALPLPTPPLYSYANSKILYHSQRPVVYPHQPAPVVTQKPFKPSPLIYYQTPKAVVNNRVREEADERKPTTVREHDEEREQERYEEDEDEFKPSGRYTEDDDEDGDSHYRVQDEEDDRSYSRNVRKPRFKDSRSASKKPKSHYESYKYSKSSTKPKKEIYESRQTQNIPIVHKHNSFHQEKWFVTKKET